MLTYYNKQAVVFKRDFLKIDDLVNVEIFINPGERMVQSQEDQVEEGEFLKWFPLVLMENQM